MADQAFESTKGHIDQMKQEVEVDRLKLEEERNDLEIKIAELE